MIFRLSMIVSRKNSVSLHLISFNSVQQYGKSRLHLHRHQWLRVCRRQGLDAAVRLCTGDRGTVGTFPSYQALTSHSDVRVTF